MHISFLPTSTPPDTAPEQAILDANLRWLREESDGVWSPEQKAAIRNEIGVLEQLAGRDSVAVRDLLASVNSLASFREPLERLIVLIERHRSFKNLPTLLEHLCRTADNPEEVARAELLRAWYAIVHARDDARGLLHTETALQARPDDPVGLLTLEILARRSGDNARLRRALEARRASSADPVWASLLGIELAASYVDAGEYDVARGILLDASRTDDEVGFGALERLVALGDAARRTEWVIEALGAMAARAAPVLGSGVSAPQRVPALDRSATRTVSRLLRKAELERQLGRDDDAFTTLEQAARLDADNPVLSRAFLRQAERVGQHSTATALALGETEKGLTAAETAALCVRAAQSQIHANELAPALDALRRASSVDSGCWVARALELDLLRGMRNPAGQAETLEQIALVVQDSEARGRYWLLAADAWARDSRDVTRAVEALAKAESSGTPSAVVRRVERALAHAAGEQGWYCEATERLLATTRDTQEKAGLGLELWRAACLSGDFSEASRFRELVESVPEGRLTARLTRAYDPMLSDEASHVALAQLAELEQDPARSIALRWTGALRLLCAGARPQAIERLKVLHAEHPDSAAAAGTLSALLAAEGSSRAASAQVLRLSAQAMTDDLFAASLYIEAGLDSWQAGQSTLAQSDFEAAEQRGAGCAWALSSWTRRANTDALTLVEARAREPVERLLLALERATGTVTPNSRDVIDLDGALRALGEGGPQNLVAAGRLLSLVLGRALGMRADGAALDRFAALSPDASRVAEAWRYLECMDQPAPSQRTLEESTRKWSETSGGLPAALEWLAAAQRLAHRRRECEARKRVGELVSGPAREACVASAMLVAHLTQAEPTTLLAGLTPALRLTNLETSPPGCDPKRRVAALEGAPDLLGEESEAMVALLAGYNLLALGEVEAAAMSFRRYCEAFPEDPSGWEGLLAAARRGNDAVLLAEAASALGTTSRDPAYAARLFEEAADIFLTRLNDDVAGVAALSRAVDLDIRRTSSFEKLFVLRRDSAAPADLLELLTRRLRVATLPEEIRTLHWERARALRQQGDTAQALSALDEVTASDPHHLGALALAGEIYITTHRYSEAADKLAELAARADAPPEQRLTSGLAAVDLFENQLGATSRALQVLLVLHRAGLSTLSVRERLARAAAKSDAWDDAVIVLEQLMFERNTDEERAEAARLALAIHRDRRLDPRSAGPAAEVLLRVDPEDAEALDLALSGSLDPHLTEKLLGMGRNALVTSTSVDPTQVESLKRLARIADRLGDMQLRQSTLGALVALGHGHSVNKSELMTLERRLSTIPPVALDDDLLAELADPEDKGPIPTLLALVAPYMERALGPTLKTFQVGRRERVSASSGSPVRNEIAAWVGAFQLRDFELYVSPIAEERIATLATEPVSVIIGSHVTAPLGPFQRQGLARSLYALRRGLGVLTQLEELEIAALVVALCNLAGVQLTLPAYARQRDFERELGKALPRKVRQQLPDLVKPIVEAQAGIPQWVRAALASLDRAAAIAVGDASVVVSALPVLQEPLARAASLTSERTRRLLRFVLSPRFEAMRQSVGATVR